MRLPARLGLAITHPRWALSLASDRAHAGRSGSDLIVMICMLLVATRLAGLSAAAWLGAAVSPGLGMRAAMHLLTRALTVDLGFLVLAALLVFGLAGSRRNLGRAFDLACVAALPLLFVDLGATVVVRLAHLEISRAGSIALASVSYAWAGALVALAVRPARTSSALAIPDPPAVEVTRGRRAGWAVIAVALVGTVAQVLSIVRDVDQMRPMTQGDVAPPFALPAIQAKGVLGAPVELAASRGKLTIVDFWATWCGPCLRSMPALDALAKGHPADVTVLAINLDDPVAARALFDDTGYKMTLVYDDGSTSERYGVTTIPHTIVIDREGVVRHVYRGGNTRLESVVERMLSEEIRK